MRDPAGSASRLTREKPTASRKAMSVRSSGETICHANSATSKIGTAIMTHEAADRRALRMLKFKVGLPVERVVWGPTLAAATITMFLPISPSRAASGSLDAGRARSPTQPAARGLRTRSDLDRPARRVQLLLYCATYAPPGLPRLLRITPP